MNEDAQWQDGRAPYRSEPEQAGRGPGLPHPHHGTPQGPAGGGGAGQAWAAPQAADPYASDPYAPAPYAPDPYAPDPYPAGPYAQQSRGADPYAAQPGPGPYTADPYAAGPYGQPAAQGTPGTGGYGGNGVTPAGTGDGLGHPAPGQGPAHAGPGAGGFGQPHPQGPSQPGWETGQGPGAASHQSPYQGPAGEGGAPHEWDRPGWRSGGPAAADDETTAYLPPATGEDLAVAAAPAANSHRTASAPAAASAPSGGPGGAGSRSAAPAPETTGSADAPVYLARLAPNQRARALGHSPIIAPGLQPAVLTAVLSALLALTSGLPRLVPAVVVALLQAVTAAGWFRLNGMWPARQGIALAFLAGLVTDVALLCTDREHAPVVGLATLGVWCLLVLVLQLRHRGSADERMASLTAGLASSALAVLAAGHLAAAPGAALVGAVAVAVATLARALPLPGVVSVVVALLAAAGAGIAAGRFTDFGTTGAVLGLAAGVCALVGLRVASYDYPSRFVHLTAGVALPLALAAPAVYVVGRVLS
ncbi:hypothetical protein ACFV3R_24840 [Streptomyces sp. NPDC059740]|uniref:hypothetical protein n=1 Tax=Streptomyces sp. NPDC059740 TaxID=3346926 RepID=UPI00364B4C98